MSELSERLKEARDARHMTQGELAAAVKRRHPTARLTQQNLASLELGKHKTTRYIAELAETLDVNTDWLALGKGPRDRTTRPESTITDQRLLHVLRVMEPMSDYQKNQAVKILDTLAESDAHLKSRNRVRTG